jgi:hypothetical protein
VTLGIEPPGVLINNVDLIPSVGYGQAFISHDDWIEVSMQELSELEVLKGIFGLDSKKSA